MLRRIAGSIDWETAVKDLIAARYWPDAGGAYVIRHHANVILQSLSALAAKQETGPAGTEARPGPGSCEGRRCQR
jgi:hypothetical protein